jgi:hypothetical protein
MSLTGHGMSSSITMHLFRKTLTVKRHCLLTALIQERLSKHRMKFDSPFLDSLSSFKFFLVLEHERFAPFALSFVSLVRIKLSNQKMKGLQHALSLVYLVRIKLTTQKIFSLHFREYSSTVQVAPNQIQKLR